MLALMYETCETIIRIESSQNPRARSAYRWTASVPAPSTMIS